MTPERLAEVYAIVVDLLVEAGYERLTLDKVAARARMSKMTLYRQWEGKSGLVMAAVRHRRPARPERPEVTSLEEAFARMAGDADRGAAASADVRLVFTLLQAAAVDPEVGAELRRTLIEPPAGELAAMFGRAADRGEIERDDALFRRLAYVIIEHFVLLGVLDGESDSAERRLAFFRSVIAPALTFTGDAAAGPTDPAGSADTAH